MTPLETLRPLLDTLHAHRDPGFAERMQRFFPEPIRALGVANADVRRIAAQFARERPGIGAAELLALADALLTTARFHEEVLLAFALLGKVAPALGPELIDRSRVWLENVVSNWAQCDDLCLTVLHHSLRRHPGLLPRTRDWVESPSAWARRASCVVVVPLVRTTAGRAAVELPIPEIFDTCTRLLRDEDDYVQKGVGWLLKATSQVHPAEVAEYLEAWRGQISRSTFRYAVEKLEPAERARLMALGPTTPVRRRPPNRTRDR